MKRGIIVGIITSIFMILLLVLCFDLSMVNSRVEDYLKSEHNYSEIASLHVDYNDNEYHVYENEADDGFLVVKFEELPKSIYIRLQILDFIYNCVSTVIIV